MKLQGHAQLCVSSKSLGRHALMLQLDNKYGSPSLEDIETFQSTFRERLEALLGPSSEDLEVSVSSPVCISTSAWPDRPGFRGQVECACHCDQCPMLSQCMLTASS